MIFGSQLGCMGCAIAAFVLGQGLFRILRKNIWWKLLGMASLLSLIFLASFVHAMYGLSDFYAASLGGVACAVWIELNIGRHTAKGTAQ